MAAAGYNLLHWIIKQKEEILFIFSLSCKKGYGTFIIQKKGQMAGTTA
jgi:hypothetical protein